MEKLFRFNERPAGQSVEEWAELAEATVDSLSTKVSFEDALRVARGCTDYGGGYRYDRELFEAFRAGIYTVIGALEKLQENGMSDSQTRALYRIGGEVKTP